MDSKWSIIIVPKTVAHLKSMRLHAGCPGNTAVALPGEQDLEALAIMFLRALSIRGNDNRDVQYIRVVLAEIASMATSVGKQLRQDVNK